VNTLYSKGGLHEVLRGVRDHIEHEVLGEPYSDTRSDNNGRWEFISSHISHLDSTLTPLKELFESSKIMEQPFDFITIF